MQHRFGPDAATGSLAGRSSRWPGWAATLLAAVATVATPANAPLPTIERVTVRDVAGVAREIPDQSGARATVLIFTTHDCPVANASAPEIQRLWREFPPNKAAFYLVHVDPDLTADSARQHAREYGLECPLLLDPKHELVRRVGATVTPEAAVILPDGRVVYRGRIDDLYPELGKRRARPTERTLREAVRAVLAGQPVQQPVTRAVGCFIPPVD